MAGTGWACPGGKTCTRSDVLNGGASYPVITVTVNVAGTAPSSVTNRASVSGGGSATATASDNTVITSVPVQVNLTSPGSGATSQSTTPTLSWSASSNATSYDLYLGSGNPPSVYGQNLSGTSSVVTTALNAGTTYYWNVVAKNSAGSAPASSTWSFTTAASVPGQVTLTSPGSGATSQSTTPTLSWTASSNATSYDLYLGSSNPPSVYAQNLSGTSSVVTTALNAGTTYYWNVVAKNSAGSAPASSTFSFTTAASVPGQVTLTSPGSGATSQSTTPTLSWTASSNATSYDLYLGSGNPPSVYAQNLSGTSSVVTTALNAGTTYYWNVVAKNSAGSALASSTFSFTTAAGGSSCPAGSQTFTTSTTWTVPGGCTSLILEAIGAGGGGQGGFVYQGAGGGGGGYSTATITANPGSVYAVTVGAGGGGGAFSQFSVAGGDSYVQIAGVDQVRGHGGGGGGGGILGSGGIGGSGGAGSNSGGPGGNAGSGGGGGGGAGTSSSAGTNGSGGAVGGSFGGGAGGTAYPGRGASGTAPGGGGGGGATNPATYAGPGGLGGNGQVRISWSGTSGGSPPSQVTLTSPGSGATSQSTTPTLSWTASSNATSYDLYLGSSNPPSVYAQNLSGTSSVVTTAMNAGTTYYWNVVAKNSAGSALASSTWSFTTAASVPGQVTLTSPGSGATSQSTTPTLSWSASSNATSYDLYLGSGNPPSVYAQNLSGTSSVVTTALNAGTTYYWNVVAKNSAGSALASSTFSFTTAASVPGQVTLTSPGSGATSQSTTPTLSWSASSNATSYDLYLGSGNPPSVYA